MHAKPLPFPIDIDALPCKTFSATAKPLPFPIDIDAFPLASILATMEARGLTAVVVVPVASTVFAAFVRTLLFLLA